MQTQPIEQIENSVSSIVPPSMDLTFEDSRIDGTFCPPTAPETETVPRSPSNNMAITLESFVSTAGSRIFLDLCAGYQRPLSSSLQRFHCDVCTFDILVHPEDDLLDDTRYELLLRLACSRQVAYSAGSPSCNEYSRLKLRPGGPAALRTPDQLDGIPGLTFDQQLRLQSSATMLSRVVTCLILTYLSGGHCHLEQPSKAMSWLEPEVQPFIANVGIHCVMLAACAYNMDVDKSWIFATSLDSLRQLGTTCNHPKGTHESIIGTKHPDGSFKSRDTAQYPPSLCDAFARIVQHMFSKHSIDLPCNQIISFVAHKDRNAPPFSCEDGGGIPSQPDWSQSSRHHQDVFKELRSKFFQSILDKKLHLQFVAHVDSRQPTAPFSSEDVEYFSSLISDFLKSKNLDVNWSQREHQPMFLEIMQQLSVVMLDVDVNLFDCLIKGVSTGFQNDIPPSNCFGRNDRPALPETPLSIHLANWQSAKIDMEVTRNLVQEEINQGWVYQFEGGIEAAKEFFPAVAVGRLGVAYSDSRPPRLVVDSSVCGVNARCHIPERTTLPTAKDVIRCYPLRGSNAELAGFSLDIKSAHKRVVIRQEEQGLLGFQIDGKVFFYRVCPFGATFSAFWRQRVGGWILRFFHLFIWLSHSAFLYVDDYFWIQRKDIIHLTSTTLAMLCRCLGIPISWKKCELSHTVPWIGWTFHIAAGYISLPQDKRSKLVKYVKSLIAHNRIPRNQLEKPLALPCGSPSCFHS